MCLAIPARITAIDPTGQSATVALGAVTRDCSLALIEDAAVGDYVLMHVGYALNRIGPEEAQQTLALMREAGVLVDQDGLAPAFGGPAGPA